MPILGYPVALRRPDGIVEIGEHRTGRESVLERGSVDERLEGRTRLTLRLCDAVETALLEVAAADHRAHGAGLRIHGDERRLQRFGQRGRLAAAAQLPLLDVLQAAAHFGLSGLLQVEIERRVNLQSALVHTLPTEPRDQFLPDFLLEVLAEGFLTTKRVGQLDRRLQRRFISLVIDKARIAHCLKYDVPSRDSTVQVNGWRVSGRGLDQSGEQRAFRQRQIGGGLAEVAKRRRLSAVDAIAEVDLVQVQLQNLALVELPFDAGGHNRLFHLAAVRLFRGQKALPGELLREGARALRRAPGAHVRDQRTGDADNIEAAMLVEALILDCQDRLHQIWRDAIERDGNSLFLIDRERRSAVDVVQRRRLSHNGDFADVARTR